MHMSRGQKKSRGQKTSVPGEIHATAVAMAGENVLIIGMVGYNGYSVNAKISTDQTWRDQTRMILQL